MGRTGKPQKSGKHKKIKAIDPFYIGDRKDRRVKGRDMRPQNDDSQEFPGKLKRLMKNAADIHNLSVRKRKKMKMKAFYEDRGGEKGMRRALEPVPKFKQRKGESDRGFMGRVERETQSVILKSKLEDKFKVKFQENEGGEVVIKKKGLSKKKKERLQEKKEKKKEKKQDKINERKLDFEQYKDEVKFGEVVQGPPSLTAKPRKSNNIGHPNKPGQRSLLLKDIISQNVAGGSMGAVPDGKRQVGETVKRRLLSPAQQLIMDNERERAIDLYRQLKEKKQKVS